MLIVVLARVSRETPTVKERLKMKRYQLYRGDLEGVRRAGLKASTVVNGKGYTVFLRLFLWQQSMVARSIAKSGYKRWISEVEEEKRLTDEGVARNASKHS